MAQQTPAPRMLRGDEAQLFRDYEKPLRAAVRYRANVPEAIVDDACSYAWLQLCRCQPDRTAAFAWLRTVAIREAWRLARRERRERMLVDPTEPAADQLDHQLRVHCALRALAELPERQRRILTLLISGLSYAEIAQRTGTSCRTVDRQLGRARRHLRLVRDAD